MATIYRPCPNGCGGEVPVEVEQIYDAECGDLMEIGIDDVSNEQAHEEGCLPLTPEQREKVEDEAYNIAQDGDFWASQYDYVGE